VNRLRRVNGVSEMHDASRTRLTFPASCRNMCLLPAANRREEMTGDMPAAAVRSPAIQTTSLKAMCRRSRW
jgi:hypothetical protein